jgi:hypothetical protein
MNMLSTDPLKLVRTETVALVALALLMIATRMEHFGGAMHLPDASLAVFALAGWAGARATAFVGLLALAAGIDYLAINVNGVAADCFTPAYPALAVAYGALFAFGRRARLRELSWALATGAVATLGLAFAISNLSFYQFSGLYADMPMRDYVAATWRYAPAYVGYGACYILLGVAVAAMWSRLSASSAELRNNA